MIKSSLLALLLCVVGSALPAQAAPQPTPLPAVDLTALEAEVAEQLSTARLNLEQLLAAPAGDGIKQGEAYGNLGQLYHAYGLLQAAASCYRNAAALQPQQPTWHYLHAVVNELQGNHPKAIEALQQLLSLRPEDLPARLRLARIYRSNGEHEAAKKMLDSLLAQYPSLPAVEAEQGELALAVGNNQEAVRHLRSALQKVPQATRLYYPLALAYRNLGETEQAREYMARRGDVGITVEEPLLSEIESLKSGERLHLLRGKLAFAAADYDAAAAAFTKAVEARPESARAHINLGTTLSMLGDTKKAMQHFEQALKLEPDNITAHFNAGSILLQRGEIDEGYAHLQRVVELSPKDVAARLQLATVLLQKNRAAEAFEQYKQIIKIDPASVVAWMNAANLLVAAQQYAEAKALLQQGHRTLPHAPRLGNALARLLAASPDHTIRHAQQGLQLAQQLYQRQPTLNHAYTVSLALAESGQCDQAARFLQHAWEQLNSEDKPLYRDRVKQSVEYYRSHSPCRDGVVW